MRSVSRMGSSCSRNARSTPARPRAGRGAPVASGTGHRRRAASRAYAGRCLLATVGLYAVTAYAAAQRTREIGVRVALGAQAKQIWWLVTRSAAWQLGIGLSIGMVGAIGMGRFLGSVLIGTKAMDPVTLFGVAGLLAVVGLSACFLPARRAMRLDPAAVLRYE